MQREELAMQIGNYVLNNAEQLINNLDIKEPKPTTVSVKGLAKMLGVSESSIYDPISNSDEFLKIEADFGSKRLWYADQVDKAWRSYLRKYGSRGIDRLPRSEQHRILVEEG